MKKEFKTQIKKVEGKNASYIEIPFDVEDVHNKLNLNELKII